MKFEDARENLIKFYAELGLNTEKITDDFIRLIDSDGDYTEITTDHIQAYADVADDLGDIVPEDGSPTIIGPDFRERLVRVVGGARRLASRNTYSFKKPGGKGPWIEIGPASPSFVNFLRFDENYIQYVKKLLEFDNDVEDMLDTYVTAKIFNVSDPSDDAHDVCLEARLFELSYSNNLHLSLSTKWPYDISVEPTYRSRPISRDTNFDLKPVLYNPEVVKFYMRGSAILDPYIQFLSYYHVMEYYFVSVNDEALYSKLKSKFSDPMFEASPKYLDGIITAISGHRTSSDETEMLKGVVSKYVDPEEMADFIRSYEEKTKRKIYTNSHKCFGHDLEKVNLEKQHIFGCIAKRLKIVRNALVHSSDRYERKERYIPGENADLVLRKEVPLVRFIAEQVIIANARVAVTA